jgi:hypothetical protein
MSEPADPWAGAMWCRVPWLILDDPALPLGAVQTLAHIARYAEQCGDAYPSRELLALAAGVTLATVDRRIAKLVQRKLLRVEERAEGGNRYILLPLIGERAAYTAAQAEAAGRLPTLGKLREATGRADPRRNGARRPWSDAERAAHAKASAEMPVSISSDASATVFASISRDAQQASAEMPTSISRDADQASLEMPDVRSTDTQKKEERSRTSTTARSAEAGVTNPSKETRENPQPSGCSGGSDEIPSAAPESVSGGSRDIPRAGEIPPPTGAGPPPHALSPARSEPTAGRDKSPVAASDGAHATPEPSAAGSASSASSGAIPRGANRYPKPCSLCHAVVEPGAGLLGCTPEGKPIVTHRACPKTKTKRQDERSERGVWPDHKPKFHNPNPRKAFGR